MCINISVISYTLIVKDGSAKRNNTVASSIYE